jgi:hypothetical protein
MARNFSGRDAAAVEDMIDQMGVVAFIRLVADVCDAKSAHVEENWQDDALANDWNRLCNQLDTLSKKDYLKHL